MEDWIAKFTICIDDGERNNGVGRFVGLEKDGFGGGVAMSRVSWDEGRGVCCGEEGCCCSYAEERREVDHFVCIFVLAG